MFNNLAWGWEAGLPRNGLEYAYGIGGCVPEGGADFYLTTRLGIGRSDFRGGFGAYLRSRLQCCAGWSIRLINNSAWGWEAGLRRGGL